MLCNAYRKKCKFRHPLKEQKVNVKQENYYFIISQTVHIQNSVFRAPNLKAAGKRKKL